MEHKKNRLTYKTFGTTSLLAVSALLLNHTILAKAAPTENNPLNPKSSLMTSSSIHTEFSMKVIKGYVLMDDDKDGKGDYALRTIAVSLLDGKGNIIRSTQTDSNGFYQFINIPTGNYTLRFSIGVTNEDIQQSIRYQNVDYPIYMKSYDIYQFNLLIREADLIASVEVPTIEAPTTEVPTTEVPTTEAPTTEAPTTEAPTTEAPTTEAPTTEAPTTEAPTTEAPTTEAPTTEAPTTEVPTTEAPTTEAPTTEAPTTEAPTTEAPTTEAPTTEVPTTEVPTTEAPTTEAPTTEAPTTEAPTTEVPTTEVPTTEVPTTEAPTTEAPTTEVPTTEVPTTEVPTTEAPTTEAPTTEAPTTEVPTTEAPTTEVPTTEAPTTEVPTTEVPTTEAPTTEAPTTEVPTTEVPTRERATWRIPEPESTNLKNLEIFSYPIDDFSFELYPKDHYVIYNASENKSLIHSVEIRKSFNGKVLREERSIQHEKSKKSEEKSDDKAPHQQTDNESESDSKQSEFIPTAVLPSGGGSEEFSGRPTFLSAFGGKLLSINHHY